MIASSGRMNLATDAVAATRARSSGVRDAGWPTAYCACSATQVPVDGGGSGLGGGGRRVLPSLEPEFCSGLGELGEGRRALPLAQPIDASPRTSRQCPGPVSEAD